MRAWELNENIIAYHGSLQDDPKFVMGHSGQNSHTFGEYTSNRYGIFFTDNKEFADMYGEVNTYNINVNNTIDFDKDRGDTIYEFVESLDAHDEIERPIWMDAREILHGSWAKWQLFEEDLGRRFVEFLKNLGYDSAVFTEYNEDENGKEHKSRTTVVFDPSKIKKIESGKY